MLKLVSQGQIPRPYLSRLYHQAHTVPRSRRKTAAVVTLVSGIAVGSYLWRASSRKIHNDTVSQSGIPTAIPFIIPNKHASPEGKAWRNQDTLHALVWGSNRCVSDFFVKVLNADILKTFDTRSYDFQYGCIRK